MMADAVEELLDDIRRLLTIASGCVTMDATNDGLSEPGPEDENTSESCPTQNSSNDQIPGSNFMLSCEQIRSVISKLNSDEYDALVKYLEPTKPSDLELRDAVER